MGDPFGVPFLITSDLPLEFNNEDAFNLREKLIPALNRICVERQRTTESGKMEVILVCNACRSSGEDHGVDRGGEPINHQLSRGSISEASSGNMLAPIQANALSNNRFWQSEEMPNYHILFATDPNRPAYSMVNGSFLVRAFVKHVM